jgi:DNA-binding CsgD family transcriptional regulator
MPIRLRPEEIVAILVLDEKGMAKREIAWRLGVTEGLVRYHLRRRAEGAVDGRRRKAFKAASLADVIAAWFEGRTEGARPVNVRDLFDHLVQWNRYPGSYRFVLRLVGANYPGPKIRTYRRVETPPGVQTQIDWGEYPSVDLGDGPEALSASSSSRRPLLRIGVLRLALGRPVPAGRAPERATIVCRRQRVPCQARRPPPCS